VKNDPQGGTWAEDFGTGQDDRSPRPGPDDDPDRPEDSQRPRLEERDPDSNHEAHRHPDGHGPV
jgi:hypothetical protein